MGYNASYDENYINAGTIPSGTLSLDLIGSNSSNLSYVFPGGFTVASGSTLNVGTNVTVEIQAGQTLSDSGTLNFATGDTVSFNNYAYDSTTSIVVNGNDDRHRDDTFSLTTNSGYTTVIQVNSGGHLTASNSTFTLTQLSLDNSSVLNKGDWQGNVFDTPVFLPYNDVQYLGDNASFDDIDINAGTISSGTLSFNQIGTNTSNLRYVFPGGFTVASGATLNVGVNVSVLIQQSQSITDSGTLSFANGDTVSFNAYAFSSTTSMAVNGTMTAAGTYLRSLHQRWLHHRHPGQFRRTSHYKQQHLLPHPTPAGQQQRAQQRGLAGQCLQLTHLRPI